MFKRTSEHQIIRTSDKLTILYQKIVQKQCSRDFQWILNSIIIAHLWANTDSAKIPE